MENYTIEQLNSDLKNHKYFIIDEKVYYIYQDYLDALDEGYVFLLKKPEQDKNLSKVEEAAIYFTENGIRRNDQLIVIGGGATTDFGGYLASIILRGINWICVPTTVLGIVDASIGGKTAVNLKNGKNLIGTFYTPIKRIVCREFLASLPESEQISGYCEILKYGFLSEYIYGLIISECERDLLFKECAQYKSDLVEKDFREGGLRKNLNLGHTIGHAIEKSLAITHGEAVCLGIEIKINIFSPHLKDTFNKLKEKLMIDFPAPTLIPKNEFENFILKDKKRSSSEIDIINILEVGKVEVLKISSDELFSKIYSDEKYGNIFK